jgi:hypothetical protein
VISKFLFALYSVSAILIFRSRRIPPLLQIIMRFSIPQFCAFAGKVYQPIFYS